MLIVLCLESEIISSTEPSNVDNFIMCPILPIISVLGRHLNLPLNISHPAGPDYGPSSLK